MGNGTPETPDFAAMPIEAVVDLATADWANSDDDRVWSGADSWLLRQPKDVGLRLALELADRPRLEARGLAAHLLGQAHAFWPEARESVCVRLRHMLSSETETAVLRQAGIAIGFWGDQEALPALVRLKTQSHSDVRYGAVHGFSGIETEYAKRHLIDLTRDEDGDVRDWAVFGLGQMTTMDFPDLREALVAALDDPNDMVRFEAVAGLAERKDPRAIAGLKCLLGRMDNDDEWQAAWGIAEDLRASELAPELQLQFKRYDAEHPAPQGLADALKACKAGPLPTQ